ncbi:helix-turn-helix domain-containing protein [Pedobacter sp. AW31-3R]|uniref:helix-turn-helix domain-containing protein n=1 Tax=Pedobacter sp. AW31-3R TaxID=3445781 RepID=UPI003F9FDDDC
MQKIGHTIKKLRQSSNWKQREIAEKLNISIPAYSKIEMGATDINIKRLRQLAAIFKVNPSDILAPEEEIIASTGLSDREEVELLKNKLAEKDEQVNQLRSKLIDLYDEVRGQ